MEVHILAQNPHPKPKPPKTLTTQNPNPVSHRHQAQGVPGLLPPMLNPADVWIDNEEEKKLAPIPFIPTYPGMFSKMFPAEFTKSKMDSFNFLDNNYLSMPTVEPPNESEPGAPQLQCQAKQPQAPAQQPQTHAQQPQAYVQQPQAYVQQPHAYVQQPQALVQQPHAHVQQPQAHVQQPQAQAQQPPQLQAQQQQSGRRQNAWQSQRDSRDASPAPAELAPAMGTKPSTLKRKVCNLHLTYCNNLTCRPTPAHFTSNFACDLHGSLVSIPLVLPFLQLVSPFLI